MKKKWIKGKFREIRIMSPNQTHKKYRILTLLDGTSMQYEHEVFVNWRLRGHSINELIK